MRDVYCTYTCNYFTPIHTFLYTLAIEVKFQMLMLQILRNIYCVHKFNMFIPSQLFQTCFLRLCATLKICRRNSSVITLTVISL